MMTDEEIRLECLRLAIEAAKVVGSGDIAMIAKANYNWVTSKRT